jgi:hypothetical protein
MAPDAIAQKNVAAAILRCSLIKGNLSSEAEQRYAE